MKWKEIYQYVLGAIIVLAFFGVLVLMILFSTELKGNDNQVLYSMVGILGTIAVMVATYFFGSSKGSADKTEMLGK
jgi:NhaP-type Na+/H+ or K+/H+ antiporter